MRGVSRPEKSVPKVTFIVRAHFAKGTPETFAIPNKKMLNMNHTASMNHETCNQTNVHQSKCCKIVDGLESYEQEAHQLT